MREGTVGLPRLNLAATAELRPALEAMGLAPAFGAAADFSAMAAIPVAMDRVVQRAVLRADEEGTIAAAATAVTMTRSVQSGPEPFSLIADRPFLLALRHASSGALVFVAYVANPGP